MRKLLAAVGSVVLFATTPADALFVDFETLPAGLTPTANPTQGGLLDNASELNDEIVPLRITSGGLSSDAADTFPSISGVLDLTGTPFAPAHSGSNVVAGLEGGSGGVGLQATIDFTQFVEIRVLQPGFTFVREWIQLFPGTSALVTVCSDLNCGTQLTQTTVTSTGFFEFTAPGGSEIRNIGVIPVIAPGTQGGGAFIDDVTFLANVTVPEPRTPFLLLAALAALALAGRARRRDA